MNILGGFYLKIIKVNDGNPILFKYIKTKDTSEQTQIQLCLIKITSTSSHSP